MRKSRRVSTAETLPYLLPPYWPGGTGGQEAIIAALAGVAIHR
jgi:hypothetical protein